MTDSEGIDEREEVARGDRMDAAEQRMAAGENRAAASESRADTSATRADEGEARMRATEDAIAAEAGSRSKALIEMRETVGLQAHTIERILVAIGELTTAVGVRPTKRETWGIVSKAILATLLLVVAIFGLNLWALSQSSEDRKTLVECTTPSEPGDVHECYEAGQDRTADAIARIVRANIVAAQCALDGAPDLTACVEQHLAEDP